MVAEISYENDSRVATADTLVAISFNLEAQHRGKIRVKIIVDYVVKHDLTMENTCKYLIYGQAQRK